MNDVLKVGDIEIKSRLIVGTGKYASMQLMVDSLKASACDMVTVALRRANIDGTPAEDMINHLKDYTILPNTAGCFSAKEAIRVARLAREMGIGNLVKLEVLGDEKTLLPDPVGTLEATEILVKEGFTVFAYTNDDPIMAKRLEDAGAATVMPAGAPIGSGRGILNPSNIVIILENATVPIIVDAGVGTASDVSEAFELGVAGVLLNTGIAGAKDPVLMGEAMRLAASAGRKAFLAGRIPKRLYAKASSPIKDF
jgi:thiazole synthase